MKLLRPYTITDSNLTSNVPENDAGEYSATATYGAGEVVISSTLHRKYESLVADNTGNALDDVSKWLDLGPTNRWAMFDTKNGTATTAASPIDIDVLVDGRADGLALLGLDATSVTVTMTAGGFYRQNLMTYSQDFSQAVWNADGTTKTAGVSGAPDGTASVGQFSSATTSTNYPRNTAVNLTAGVTYTISAWVAVSGPVTAEFAYFNGTSWVTSGALAVGSTLERMSWTFTATGTPSLGTGFKFAYGAAGTVFVWGYQIQEGTTLSEYLPTTTSAASTNIGTVYNQTYDLLSDSGINNWYSYFTEEIVYASDLVLTDMPLYGDPTVSVTITNANGDASCGTFVIGQTRELGGTVYGAKGGIQDYSRKETDDFGNYTLVERAFAKRNTYRVVCANAQVDAIFNLLATVRAVPVIWLGTDDYAFTWTFGWARDWAVEIAYPTQSFLTIEIEGLT